MKTAILTGLASLTLFDIAIATAADIAPARMATKAPVYAPVPAWTGWYLGGHAGYRWADADFSSAAYTADPDPIGDPSTTAFPARSESFSPNSFLGGVHAGYNHQLSPIWLVGIEGDWSWAKDKETKNANLNFLGLDSIIYPYTRSSTVELDWQASLRGRLGYIQGPMLWYVTGGAAFIHAKWSESLPASGLLETPAYWSNTKTLTGWTIGGGLEYMWQSNWLLRAEYLYADYGTFHVEHGFRPQPGNIDITTHTARIGISYKFGGPVVARY